MSPITSARLLTVLATTVPALAGIACREPPMTPSTTAEPAIHNVVMVLDGVEYRFKPAHVQARPGDVVRFTQLSGGPHNVMFWADSMPAGLQPMLDAAMPGDKLGPLMGPLLLEPNESYDLTIPDLPPGRYAFACVPHLAMGMVGALTVHR